MYNHKLLLNASQEKKLLLLGKYSLDNNKLRSIGTDKPIIHIRERAHPTGNSRYFLAYHSPTFQYISNLYPTPTVRDSLAIGEVKLDHKKDWYIDYRASQYKVSFEGKRVTISQIGGQA